MDNSLHYLIMANQMLVHLEVKEITAGEKRNG